MTNQDVIDVLIDARDRIVPDNAWTRYASARDEVGDGVEATSPDAVCWCMSGTLLASTPDSYNLFLKASVAICHVITEDGRTRIIPEFNDYVAKNKKEVIAVFDKAISNLKATQ